jgi:hypothetical protein
MLTLAMAVHGEATCAADVEGAYSYALVAAGEPCVRLIHRVFSEDGAMIGDPLVRDIAFGISSEESPGTVVDCLPDSLRDAAAAYKRVNLSYSSAWAANAASVSISAVALSGKGGMETSVDLWARSGCKQNALDASETTRGSGFRLSMTIE